ncbi:hypothetical protein LMG3458_02978 [Achromobacter deleyi]|uniref:Autotransporter domain-containing protein n=1 Tax=Achromobacter deleyi TaxID=1353891 RepID=A0A6S7A0M0_9BURK|nr:hypothetical protein LMG3458_02978 [Achromobacter deleyi]CAB3864757.1 hypothetical protein LMG3481_02443 [Achromobacter deleyi]CAB3879484.1 hypothetical protein LMG3482_03217 [Achromobacter deleyi]
MRCADQEGGCSKAGTNGRKTAERRVTRAARAQHGNRQARRLISRLAPLTVALFAAFAAMPVLAQEVPQGTYTEPFQVRDGEEKVFVGGTIINPTPPYPAQMGGTGIQVIGGSAILDPSRGDGSPIRINVSGNAIDGLYVRSGGKIEVKAGGTYIHAGGGDVRGIYNVGTGAAASEFDGTNVYVTTDFFDSHALRSFGVQATTVLHDSTLTTLQDNSKGVELWQGAGAELNQVDIQTRGDTAYGIHVLDSARITTNGGSVTTEGATSYGVLVQSQGAYTGDGTRIHTQGAGAVGVYVNSNGVFQGNNMWIQSDQSYGVYVSGGQVGLVGTTINGVKDGTYGLFATSSAPVTIQGGAVQTQGNNAVAVRVQSGSVADIDGAYVHTVGQASHGVHVEGWGTVNLGRHDGTGTLVSTEGDGADAVRVSPNATRFSATGATLHAAGPNAQGLHLTGTAGAAAQVFDLTDSAIASDQADGIHLTGGPAVINLTGSSVTGGNAAFNIGADAPGQADIVASGSLIDGRVLTQAGSTTNLNLADGSTWQVTGDSVVTTLVNVDSLVNLRAAADVAANPTRAASYHVVQVTGDYRGDNGALGVNTYLNAGGALADQHTDRLLIVGDASGTTYVQVTPVAGSPGGLTTPDGSLGAHEGISLVQVGGHSTAQAFALPGGYAVTHDSPYAYHLYAYGPGSENGAADASQSLVGNGDSFWDYRLQSAYVTPEGPVDPGGGPGGSPSVPSDARPAVAPQVASYLTAPIALQYATIADLDSLHRRLGEIRDDRQLTRDQGPGEFFFRAYGGDFSYNSNRGFKQYGYDADGDYSAIQLGGNLLRLRDDHGTWRFGAAGTLGWLNFTPDAVDGHSKGKADIYRLSGYATYQSQQGWYVDSILSVGRFDGSIATDARGKAMDLRGYSYATSVEAGYPIALSRGFILEPQAQVIAQRLTFDRRSDVDGLDVDIGSQNQVTGRLGVRLTRPFELNRGILTPYLGLDVVHGFVGGSDVRVGDVRFDTGKYGDAMRLSIGATGTVTEQFSLYGEVARQEDIGSAGVQSWMFNGGIRYLF